MKDILNTKILLLLAFIIPVSLSLTTDNDFQTPGTPFKSEKWAQSLSAAKGQNKAIFLAAYTEWCGKCKLLNTRVLSDQDLLNKIQDKFYAVKMNMDEETNPDAKQLISKYDITSYPTFLVISSNGTLVSKQNNTETKEDLLKWIDSL